MAKTKHTPKPAPFVEYWTVADWPFRSLIDDVANCYVCEEQRAVHRIAAVLRYTKHGRECLAAPPVCGQCFDAGSEAAILRRFHREAEIDRKAMKEKGKATEH